jgi:hypothetical protein
MNPYVSNGQAANDGHAKTRTKVLKRSAYSPDLSPRDFDVLGPLEKALKGRTFASDNNVQMLWYSVSGNIPRNFLQMGYADLCINGSFV